MLDKPLLRLGHNLFRREFEFRASDATENMNGQFFAADGSSDTLLGAVFTPTILARTPRG